MESFFTLPVHLLVLINVTLQWSTFSQAFPIQHTVSESRPTPHFTGIRTNGPMDVALQLGNTEFVTLEARPDILPFITISADYLNPLTLHIRLLLPTLPHFRHSLGHMRVTVTARAISSVETGGSGAVFTLTPLLSASLRLVVGGNGNLTATVITNSLSVDLKGSGNAYVSGQVADATLIARGPGTLHGQALTTTVARVAVSGVEVFIWSV